jgi:hypothetical protein
MENDNSPSLENARSPKIKLRSEGEHRDVTAQIVGAYSDGGWLVLLCLYPRTNGRTYQLCLLNTPEDPLRVQLCPAQIALPPEEWPRFLSLPAKTVFRVGGQSWGKLDIREIKRRTGRKLFTCQENICAQSIYKEIDQAPQESATWHEGVQAQILLPPFAATHMADHQCPYCRTDYTPGCVVAAGIRRRKEGGGTYFFYECVCEKCKNPLVHLIITRPMNWQGFRTILDEMA